MDVSRLHAAARRVRRLARQTRRHRRQHEHAIAPDDGRSRSASWNLHFPADVFRLAPFRRRVRVLRDAGGIGTAPLWPEAFGRGFSGQHGDQAPDPDRCRAHRQRYASCCHKEPSRVIVVWSRLFDFQLRTRVVFGAGALARLGELARELSFARTLVVGDRGIVATGQVDRARAWLDAAGIVSFVFHDFDANPDARMVEAGRAHAAACGIDSIVALGGGSSLDCAKGINFVLTNGGTMRDYWGFGKASRPMLPSIGVPTTAGTGSEAQSYALISDADTHAKMACGDEKAAFRVAILDPILTVSQPRAVSAVAGYDTLSHAVESFVTAKRSELSDVFAREAWRLLEASYERVLTAPDDLDARGAMLVGAHEAGIAIEASML